MPEGRSEAGPDKTMAASMTTMLHSHRFKKEVRDLAEYKGPEKYPDQVVGITNSWKSGCKKLRRRLERREDARPLGKKMHSVAQTPKNLSYFVPATSNPLARVPV